MTAEIDAVMIPSTSSLYHVPEILPCPQKRPAGIMKRHAKMRHKIIDMILMYA